MANEDEYTKEKRKEKIEIDRNNLDMDTTANICTMIQETLHKEAVKFIDVVEKLGKTYKNEFAMGEFSVCLAVSDGIHVEPIASVVAGSVPGALKNLKGLASNFKEVMHDPD